MNFRVNTANGGTQIDDKLSTKNVNRFTLDLAISRLASADVCLYTRIVRYEWDPEKAKENLKDHGVSFADAVAIF